MHERQTQVVAPSPAPSDEAMVGLFADLAPALWRRPNAETRRMLSAYETAKRTVEALDEECFTETGHYMTRAEWGRMFFLQAWRMQAEAVVTCGPCDHSPHGPEGCTAYVTRQYDGGDADDQPCGCTNG